MLRFAEELILLLVDKEHGDLVHVPERSLRSALAGAVLMDLSLEERIDTDLQHLFVVDPTPLGDDLLDPCLALLARGRRRDAAYWINDLAQPEISDRIREKAIDRLARRGILKRERASFLSLSRRVVRARRYPGAEGEDDREVELRIMGVLFSDDIPGPRDVMLISLVDACGLFEQLLTREERTDVEERLDLIRNLDLIGRTVFHVIGKAGGRDEKERDGWVPGAATPAAHARAVAAQPRAGGGGIPVAGNAFSMAGDIVGFLAKQYRKLGPVFRVRAFSRAYTVLCGPEANMLLQRKGRVYFRSLKVYEGVAEGLGAHRVILNMDGGDHFQLRRVLRNGYSRAYLLNRAADATDVVAGLVDAWPVGESFNALPAVQRLICEQIGTVCTGVSPAEHVDDLAFYIEQLLAVQVLHRRPGVAMRTPRMRRASQGVQALCRMVVEAHTPKRREGMEPDLIDDVLELHRADPQALPEHDLLPACIGPFMAGLHTAASVASFMLYSVLKHAEVRERIQPEIETLFAGGVTAEKAAAMDVTRRVALETLRMYPVAPAIPRQVVNTFEFAGYTIPSGTSVLVATSVPHRLAEHYPEPKRFDIDRYTAERAEHRVPGVYAPFGLGTHRCLGDRFAELLFALTIATILDRADIVMDPPGYEMKVSYSKVPAPDKRFRIKVVRHRAQPNPGAG